MIALSIRGKLTLQPRVQQAAVSITAYALAPLSINTAGNGTVTLLKGKLFVPVKQRTNAFDLFTLRGW